jgi:2-dehydro-3-deoxyphosphogluconate aldolase / (4S)-4-hydroxy-2-oxoglutarate aldolase
MNSEHAIETIGSGRIVGILRGDFKAREIEIVAALVEAGILAVEVTLNSPDALASIGRLAGRFGTRIAVGAGTVLKPEEVQRAAEAGASFIVSPNRDLRVIEETRRCDLVSIPGCLTPSEVIEAFEAGAHAIKLFPATCVGPAFVRALRGPLPHARLVPTGGVTPESARDYLGAGAWAVAAGSELVSPDAITSGGLDRLRARAASFVAATRGERP